MRYEYQALAEHGETERGSIEALSVQEALRLIEQKGIKPLAVNPEKVTKKTAGKISFAAVVRFFDELATLLKSGVALVDALESQAENQMNGAMEQALVEITRGIQQGKSFSEVLQQASRLHLPDYMVQLIEAGELTGKLAASIESGVVQMQYEEAMASEIRNALTYPAVLVISGILAVGLVFALVVPKFTHLLAEDIDLPLLAEGVLRTGMFFNHYGLWVILLLALSGAWLGAQFAKPEFRRQWLEILSRWPLIGLWLAEAESARWTSVLAALLGSGVPVIKSLDLANQGIRMNARRQKMDVAANSVRSGEPLSRALQNQKALTPVAYNILRVGEQSGELPAMLGSLARLYEKNGRQRMQRVMVLIEPLAILLIGGAIGIIIIGIVLAITSSADIPL